MNLYYICVGGNRSLEGTIAFLFATITPIIILNCTGYLNLNTLQWSMVTVATCISAWIEAKTDQVDNLVLPLIFYIITCVFFG